jgi:predicted dehydrogenase
MTALTGDGSAEATAFGESRPIGVGLLGYAFMGRAHINGYRMLSYMARPLPLSPRLVSIAGRDASQVESAARRYGFERSVDHWQHLVADPNVQLFDNVGPNDVHGVATVAAAEAGKHVICEKPLGRSADEAFDIWGKVARTGVVHMCAFNYRFIPAVRVARAMIESGALGEIRHFRGSYLQDWGATDVAAWRFDKAIAGSGALGDLGAHVIDLARYLVGEIGSVSALTATFHDGREVDDAFEATVGFSAGAIGTLEASRFALGRKNALSFEINGSKGSVAFDLERLNELQVSDGASGFRTTLVTEPTDPFWEWWWPPGHVIGWDHLFAHELHHMLGAIAGDHQVQPHGATFEDGYRAAEVCDAILRSAAYGRRETIEYRAV